MNDTLKNLFQEWFDNTFCQSAFARELRETVEDSPWHREANSLVHTIMVVNEYVSLVKRRWSRDDMLGAIAAAFHDVGKPRAEETLTRETDGTTYRRYSGHEIISARLFVDYALSPGDAFMRMLNPADIFVISWMIEHHLPWGLATPKLCILATTGQRLGVIEPFVKLLAADQRGRISDSEKGRGTDEWVKKFIATKPIEPEQYDKKITLLVGPSGSGKSTYIKNNFKDSVIYSFDSLRHEFYETDDYGVAFTASVNDSTFKDKAFSRFIDEMKAGHPHIVVDNTNLSRKARNFFIAQARQRRYTVDVVVFFTSIQLLLSRQESRPDKTVPAHAVRQQFMQTQLPQYGEVDNISVFLG